MTTFLRTIPPVALSSQAPGRTATQRRAVQVFKGTGDAHGDTTFDALPAGGRPQPLVLSLCRTGDRDRDARTPAFVRTAATGDSLRTLAALTEQPLIVSEDAVGTPGDLSQCRERGWPRFAVVDSLSQRRLLCAGNDQLYAMPDAWRADGARSRRAAAPQTGTTLAALWKVVIDDKEMGVPTPESIESIASHRRAELHAMWMRATSPASPGGQLITNDEALAIYHYDRTEFAPAFVVMSTSWAAIRGIVGGSQGVYSPRVIRRLRALWASRKESNVIPFPVREEEGPEAA